LLLAGDQPAVADDEGLEETALDVVGATLAELVFDAPGHDLLADEAVAVVLLDVGEAGDRLALDEVGAVGQL
jgi:hypothetical protein